MKEDIIKDWEIEINEITDNFLKNFENRSFEELNWKPEPGSWSIGQNIDHIITINETYFPVIASIQSGAYKNPFMARFRIVTSFFGNFILKSVSPDRRKKIKTFPIWEPSTSMIELNILSRFISHQEELKSVIRNCRILLEENTVISSPANKHIVYTLEKAFEIMIMHEKRHFNQSMETLSRFDNSREQGKNSG